MARLLEKIRRIRRLWVQIAIVALSNGYVMGFAKGRIYDGNIKAVCFPGLNCYSCPSALGACPIGSLQSFFNSTDKFSFYIIGFLMFMGTLAGRAACGWACPFGLVQDLLFNIPFVKKYKNLPLHLYLKWLKYLVLILFVVLLPLFWVDELGLSDPWFCKYICPSGTLMGGIPLVALDEGMRAAAGKLFIFKMSVLLIILIGSIVIYRPFCKYICPLGAIYGFFNRIALYRYRINSDCQRCGQCQKNCLNDIPVYDHPNHSECIRCGKCRTNCKYNAIELVFGLNETKGKR